jgi:uncharacterized phage protein (TIGR01671 family)
MNRVIKFRAWDIEQKQWLKDEDFLVSPQYGGVFEWFFDGGTSKSALKNVEVMQFTGLLDKNGKEIYEGDIVQVFYNEKPQTDENKAYTVVIEDIRKGFLGVGEGHGEVIGNIYENPELK